MREAFSQFNPVSALDVIAEQRTAEARGDERHVIDYLSSSVEQAEVNGITDVDVLGATDYYKTSRGQHAHGATSGLLSFNGAAMAWDAFAHAETLLTQPLMVVVGDVPGGFGAYRDGLEVYGRAASRKKGLAIAQGATHYGLYDQPEPVAFALSKMVSF